MGSVTSLGIIDSVMDLETQLMYHLRGNCYPPVPSVMIPVCIEAIDAYHDEDYERLIDLPKIGEFQILYRESTQAPARAIVEQHHLEFWLPHIWDCDCGDCLIPPEEDEAVKLAMGME